MDAFGTFMKFFIPKFQYNFAESWEESFSPLAAYFTEEKLAFSNIKKILDTPKQEYDEILKKTSEHKQNL
jgi:hypothetical protein